MNISIPKRFGFFFFVKYVHSMESGLPENERGQCDEAPTIAN